MPDDTIDALVIFGATGDLAKLETFPALVGLVERGILDKPIVGVAMSGWGLDQFRAYAADSLRHHDIDPDSPAAAKMLGLLRYVDGDLTDDATYDAMSREMGTGRGLFYLEVPPSLFGRIAAGIAHAGRAEDARLMVEKPFGTDLESARELNETVHRYFPEKAVYRVDHWLGTEPVENVLFARFANWVFEPLLDRTHVASIQLTMAEDFDVSDRGRFYDRNGAIRDVVQNHMLQVLATVLADPPAGEGLSRWRDAKAAVVEALQPLSPERTVRGQYEGYLDVDGVAAGSTTETYAATELRVNSWRWADVPILIRVGKCLPVSVTEVTLHFRKPPRDVFGLGTFPTSNVLRLRMSPNTEIGLTMVGKQPGGGWNAAAEELAFARTASSGLRPYDRLISAALEGDRWLFASQETVEAAWRVVDPVLGNVVPAVPYARGTWGPKEADALLPHGEVWHDPVP
jgi:glucose-6-phosphate 1-dehydrogenase